MLENQVSIPSPQFSELDTSKHDLDSRPIRSFLPRAWLVSLYAGARLVIWLINFRELKINDHIVTYKNAITC